MASYQAIETKLNALEAKIDFVMKSFTIQKKEPSYLNPGTFNITSMTLAQLYRELSGLGQEVVEELTAEASSVASAALEGAGKGDVAPPSVELA